MKFRLLIAMIVFFFTASVFPTDIEAEYFGKDLGQTSSINHFVVNFLVGGMTGGIFGLGTSMISSGKDVGSGDAWKTYAGIGFGLGAIGGVITTFYEISIKEQFTFSKDLWQISWYGALLGGITGGAVGLIAKGEDNPYIYGGLGILLGVPTAVTLFLVLYKHEPGKISQRSPAGSDGKLHYSFGIIPEKDGNLLTRGSVSKNFFF